MRSRLLLLAAVALCTGLPAAAQSGYALAFSPMRNTEVHVPIAAPEGPFTLAAWTRFTGDPDAYGFFTILEFGNDRPFFGVVGESLVLAGTVSAPRPAPDGTWHHVAYTFDGTTSLLYVDGVEVGRADAAPAGGGDVLGIGYGIGDTAWDGLLDEVMVWNDARTPAEIAADRAGLGEADLADPDLLAYFRFDEGTGQTTANARTGGPDGVLGSTDAPEVNDPAWVPVAGTVDNEAPIPAGTFRLLPAGPNPARTHAAVALSVDRTQRIRVDAYDLLGRRVAVLHDAAVPGGATLTLTLDTAGLSDGVYLVRAAGDGAVATRSVVVAR